MEYDYDALINGTVTQTSRSSYWLSNKRFKLSAALDPMSTNVACDAATISTTN